MATGAVYIAPPTPTPARGGLTAVADIVTGTKAQVGMFGAQYLSEACGVASIYAGEVCVAGAGANPQKEFGNISLVEGAPFIVYKGVACEDLSDNLEDWASSALTFGETIAVEQGFMANTLVSTETVDLTPAGGALSLVNGVAALEGYASTVYGGVPTLHVPRSVVTRALAKGLFEARDGYVIETPQGSLVANGGGYEDNLGPDGTPAPAGEAWLYATGRVVLVQGPSVRVSAPDYRNNEMLALAERIWVPMAECFVAAVRVHLEVNDG